MNQDVYVKGVSAYLPENIYTIEKAISDGVYDSDRAVTDGFTSLRIEKNLTAPEMAVAAASPLVFDLKTNPVNTLYLCSIHRHGHKLLWPPASYVQRELKLNKKTRVMGINQGCNAAFVATSMAHDLISAGLSGDHIVLGSDRFDGSAFCRFNSDLGTLYGDAAFALRIGPKDGPYRIVFIGLESEPELEEMYRDSAPASEGFNDHDIKAAKKAFLEKRGRDYFNVLFISALQRLRSVILESIDLTKKQARFIIYPNVGAGLSAHLYANEFSDLAEHNMWDFGRSIGHTGTSDQFLGLWKLDNSDFLGKGDKVILLGAGNGLSLGAIVLEKS